MLSESEHTTYSLGICKDMRRSRQYGVWPRRFGLQAAVHESRLACGPRHRPRHALNHMAVDVSQTVLLSTVVANCNGMDRDVDYPSMVRSGLTEPGGDTTLDKKRG